MRIGIDARTILNPEKDGAIGAGHYTYQLVRHILELDKQNEYVLFFDSHVREKDVRKFSKNKNVKIVYYPCSVYKKYFCGVYDEILGLATLQKEKLDLLHSTSPESRIPMGYRGKSVVTFNGLCSCKTQDCLTAVAQGMFGATDKHVAQKASRIIAVSDSLKKELVNPFGVLKEKIEVIHNGVDERFFETPSIKKERVLGRFGIKKKYILFLGTIEAEKNIERLLRAFALFKKKHQKANKSNDGKKKFEYQLVLAGKKEGNFKEYAQVVRKLDIGRDVVFTNYVIGDEVPTLLRNAEIFVMPSLQEGFGMAILEALASGVPVLVSRIPAFVEIADGVAEFVNPLSVEEICDFMMKLLADEDLRKELSQKGSSRAKKFSWKETAMKTIGLYESMIR